MSFVYIDSQGREVNIPSVDAVRLRIELGAIKDQTRFFDSNTGKWAPAAEHEIYRTLKRQLMEVEHGFVAPPPPSVVSESTTPPEGVEVEASAAGAVSVEVDDPPEGAEGEAAEDEATEGEADRDEVDRPEEIDSVWDDEPDESASADPDLQAAPDAAVPDGVVEVEADGGEGMSPPEAREHQVIDELEGFGDLELLPMEPADDEGAETDSGGQDEDLWDRVVPDREREDRSAGEGVAGADSVEAAAASEGTDEPGATGPSDAAEAEEADDAPEVEAAAQESFVTSVEDELMGGLESGGAPSTLDDEVIELEPSLADSFSGADPMGSDHVGGFEDDHGGGGTDSGFGTGWAQDEEASGEGPASETEADAFDSIWDSPDDHHRPEPDPEADEASNDADPFADDRGVEEELMGARQGAAPPQRKLTRARTPGAERIIGMVALVAVVGAALFFGWRFLAPTFGGGGSGESEIVMPPLDQELVPRMRQLAGRASGRMAEDMLALPARTEVPEEPSEDWLAGIYLAGASDYPNVPEYWTAIRDWVQAAQTSENALFRDALRAQLDTANLAASDSEAIRDRALAGFQAAGSDRRIVYNQMLEVAERSIELHQFLLANEGQVTYEPAGSGVSRDPVLEAVPSTEALGDEMWERVGSITNAMDALGYLDRIDTERLIGVFLEKLEATAIH